MKDKIINYVKAFFATLGAILGVVFLFKKFGYSKDSDFSHSEGYGEGQADILDEQIDELKDRADNPKIDDLDGKGKSDYWNKELKDD